MDIFIKNMVCDRCMVVVRFELEKVGLHCHELELGRVDTMEYPSIEQIDKFKIALSDSGLELMENKRTILIEKIKHSIIDLVYNTDTPLKTNFSDFLSEKLDFDYTYLANIYSQNVGTTIEQSIIKTRIQRAKELIWCNEFTLTEISWILHFSSVAHLSSQFKKVTGFTPSYFKHTHSGSQLLQKV